MEIIGDVHKSDFSWVLEMKACLEGVQEQEVMQIWLYLERTSIENFQDVLLQVKGERWNGSSREVIESKKVCINFSLFFKDIHFSMSVH